MQDKNGEHQMTKQEKIEEYIRKTATKHNVSLEEARAYKMTQNFIEYMEKEGKDDSNNYNRDDLLDVDNIKCC